MPHIMPLSSFLLLLRGDEVCRGGEVEIERKMWKRFLRKGGLTEVFHGIEQRGTVEIGERYEEKEEDIEKKTEWLLKREREREYKVLRKTFYKRNRKHRENNI